MTTLKSKKVYKAVKAWRLKNPEKFRAQRIIERAIRKKEIKRLPCEVCEDLHTEAHHEDYSKPLEVNWLCHKHHGEADRARHLRLKLEAFNRCA